MEFKDGKSFFRIKKLLSIYDDALAKNENRPIRVSHGVAGEAAIRKWLLEFLPQKMVLLQIMLLDNFFWYT